VVNIRHVLAHNTTENPQRILAHALDLLRPGSSLYAVDADLSMSRSDPFDDDVRDLNDAHLAHLIDTGRDPVRRPETRVARNFGGVRRGAAICRLRVPAASHYRRNPATGMGRPSGHDRQRQRDRRRPRPVGLRSDHLGRHGSGMEPISIRRLIHGRRPQAWMNTTNDERTSEEGAACFGES
jgi:hypothetical protein